jgi:hypothetical protein
MARGLSQRHWVLFAIAVLISIAYLAAVESMPRDIGATFKALPLVWLIPAAASFGLFVLAWRKESMPVRAKYLCAGAYGSAAPVVAAVLIAVVYTWVLGMNP